MACSLRGGRPRPAVFSFTGDRAEVLADRLLDGRFDVLDLVWEELASRSPSWAGSRLRHDWDPSARTFTLEARA